MLYQYRFGAEVGEARRGVCVRVCRRGVWSQNTARVCKEAVSNQAKARAPPPPPIRTCATVVTPGVAPTVTARDRFSALISDDLPTLG